LDDCVLHLRGIVKEFPGVKALDDMHFDLCRGEIHALLGENGAGKSTLMKVLSGICQPDAGEVLFEGEKIRLKDTMDAEKRGISIVHQELAVFATSTVSENVFVNRPPRTRWGGIDYRRMHREVRALLDQYGFPDVNERRAMRRLSIGRQQIVEILRAVKKNAKILILDEPTSALTERETNVLMQIMRTLNDKGVSIIYISHRLEEVFRICDRATVMRDGKYVTTLRVRDTCKDELVRHMVGRDVVYNYGAGTSPVGGELLRVEGLSYKRALKDVSFSLHRGEVLGLAGLEGAGRTELLECIFGVHPPTAGAIYIDGARAHIPSPGAAKALGMAYITKDRKNKGLFLRMSIRDNVLAANVDRFIRRGFMQFKKATECAKEYRHTFQIKAPGVDKKVRQLSGGNQQKVLMAMWMSRHPRILLIDEPTRGIDVGTKESIHAMIREFARQGIGVLMISSEMPELISASDRVLALYEGRVSGELPLGRITEERIMALTSGLEAE
jgi:ABC-type sugar transport system ATPase subunit